MTTAERPDGNERGQQLSGPEDRLRELALLVAYGDRERRHLLARQLVDTPLPGAWEMLAETVASREALRFRAHGLEVLGLAAGAGDAATAESVLRELAGAMGPARDVDPGTTSGLLDTPPLTDHSTLRASGDETVDRARRSPRGGEHAPAGLPWCVQGQWVSAR